VTYKELLVVYRKVGLNFHKGLTIEEFTEIKKELGDEGLKNFVEENATKGPGECLKFMSRLNELEFPRAVILALIDGYSFQG